MSFQTATTGVILVDHGSRRSEANEMLLEVVKLYAEQSPYPIVEPAHMELAAPTISDAFDRCVSRGAKSVIVFPYFLAPGRHWKKDIPRLTAAAAEKHTGVPYVVTAPVGVHTMMNPIIDERIAERLKEHGDSP